MCVLNAKYIHVLCWGCGAAVERLTSHVILFQVWLRSSDRVGLFEDPVHNHRHPRQLSKFASPKISKHLRDPPGALRGFLPEGLSSQARKDEKNRRDKEYICCIPAF